MKITAKKKNKIIWIITLISFAMSLIMFGAFMGTIFANPDEVVTLGSFDYAIGDINSYGEIIESREHLYTKEMLDLNSLEIKFNKNDDITVKLYLYDNNRAYIETVTIYSDFNWAEFNADDTYNGSNAYARIVITPDKIDNEAVKLNIFNARKYINQLTVTIDK